MNRPDRKYRTLVIEMTDEAAFEKFWGDVCHSMMNNVTLVPTGGKVVAAAMGDEITRLEQLEEKYG